LPSVRTRQFAFGATASGALAAVALLLAVPIPHASAKTTVANPSGYTISITSMTPSYAKPGSTVRVSGTLTNRSGLPASGLSVELQTTPSPFTSSTAMRDFSTDPGSFQVSAPGTGFQFGNSIPSGETVRWSASFTAANAGFASFGVYGMEAEAVSPVDGALAAEGTYLPYWPSSGSSTRMKIAWVWPLIDTPHETACSNTLADDSLTGSLATSGRLGTLLSAGLAHASTAHLTWAVDPELLSEAETMAQAYKTGGDADCVDAATHAPSTAAKQWLTALTTNTVGDPMFVTPYGDVDVSALSHAGLDGDLRSAYTLGQSVAQSALHRTFESMGWPADGIADPSVLQSIASYGNLTGVVLDSSQMRLTTGYDDAVASVTTGIGDTLRVLLASDTITGTLGQASTRSAGGAFSVEQDYLAETAMIAAEAPNLQRSIVVAPPREWDPASSVANSLLTETTSAPWLEPASLSEVAAGKPASDGTRASIRDRVMPASELSAGYLGNVRQTGTSLDQYRSILASPTLDYAQRLQAALASTESSAWRGDASGGEELLTRLSRYVSDIESNIRLIVVPKATLAGKSGALAFSVYDGTDQAVLVRVIATSAAGRITISGNNTLITVQPREVREGRLSLNSHQIGTTQVRLQLVTKDNSPLPLPAKSVSVVTTLYGRAVLVLIIVALAIVVLTSAARWLRKWLADGGAGTDKA
jgi:hypothetical protein